MWGKKNLVNLQKTGKKTLWWLSVSQCFSHTQLFRPGCSKTYISWSLWEPTDATPTAVSSRKVVACKNKPNHIKHLLITGHLCLLWKPSGLSRGVVMYDDWPNHQNTPLCSSECAKIAGFDRSSSQQHVARAWGVETIWQLLPIRGVRRLCYSDWRRDADSEAEEKQRSVGLSVA